MGNDICSLRVEDANRKFYDTVAADYEQGDGRRSKKLAGWLSAQLRSLRAAAPGGMLLDIGTGSGFVARCALGIFDERIGVDISCNILSAHRTSMSLGVCAEAGKLPFRGRSFDAVTCFATLHHLYDSAAFVTEAARVLKPGGVLYIDHDMDAAFFRRFRMPLTLYRKLSKPLARYRRTCPGLSEELYAQSEYHSSGIDAVRLSAFLQDAGCTVSLRYHWYGLSPLTDLFFGTRQYPGGWAPLVSLRAVKKP